MQHRATRYTARMFFQTSEVETMIGAEGTDGGSERRVENAVDRRDYIRLKMLESQGGANDQTAVLRDAVRNSQKSHYE